MGQSPEWSVSVALWAYLGLNWTKILTSQAGLGSIFVREQTPLKIENHRGTEGFLVLITKKVLIKLAD